jgi:hypothetical protein
MVCHEVQSGFEFGSGERLQIFTASGHPADFRLMHAVMQNKRLPIVGIFLT